MINHKQYPCRVELIRAKGLIEGGGGAVLMDKATQKEVKKQKHAHEERLLKHQESIGSHHIKRKGH